MASALCLGLGGSFRGTYMDTYPWMRLGNLGRPHSVEGHQARRCKCKCKCESHLLAPINHIHDSAPIRHLPPVSGRYIQCSFLGIFYGRYLDNASTTSPHLASPLPSAAPAPESATITPFSCSSFGQTRFVPPADFSQPLFLQHLLGQSLEKHTPLRSTRRPAWLGVRQWLPTRGNLSTPDMMEASFVLARLPASCLDHQRLTT